jgi:hypothetical protein
MDPKEIDGLLPDSATLYDLRAEISDFVLPDSEALWTTEMMKRHCRTWTSVSGTSTLKHAELVLLCRHLASQPAELMLHTRCDRGGSSIAVHAVRLGRAAAGLRSLAAAVSGPAVESFTIDTIEGIGKRTPRSAYGWAQMFKTGRCAAEDGGDEVAERARNQAYKYFRALGSGSVPGLAMSTEVVVGGEGGAETIQWYTMQCPASLKTAVSYRCLMAVSIVGAEIIAVKSSHCECAAAARGHCPHILTLMDVIATMPERLAEVTAAAAVESAVPCTSRPCGWYVGGTEGVMADVTLPIHLHRYTKDRLADIAKPKASLWGASRAWRNRCNFTPLSASTNEILSGGGNDALWARVQSLAKVARVHAWQTSASLSGKVLVRGEDVIAARHAEGKRCRIGLDLWLGKACDKEHRYWESEEWEPPSQ